MRPHELDTLLGLEKASVEEILLTHFDLQIFYDKIVADGFKVYSEIPNEFHFNLLIATFDPFFFVIERLEFTKNTEGVISLKIFTIDPKNADLGSWFCVGLSQPEISQFFLNWRPFAKNRF